MEGSDCLKKKRSEKIFLLRPSTIVAISLIADRLPSGRSLLPLGADKIKKVLSKSQKGNYNNYKDCLLCPAVETYC
jgi:hypothetical protein